MNVSIVKLLMGRRFLWILVYAVVNVEDHLDRVAAHAYVEVFYVAYASQS